MRTVCAFAATCFGIPAAWSGPTSFVNWESPHVHPIDVTPDGTRLLAVNTADNRLEIFDVSGILTVIPAGSVPVGLDPVSVRARNDSEAWVVNHISDTISVVDLVALNVVATIATGDEPADVVFAGSPPRAFVTLSQLNHVKVYDPSDLGAAPIVIDIEGEDPRALATDGTFVYAAIFEAGNDTTILHTLDVLDDTKSPYAGAPNPPPNSGAGFDPPQNPINPDPPPVGHIVQRTPDGGWIDDNGADWSNAVTWDLHGHDLAVIDANTSAVSYVTGLMNMNMAVAVDANGNAYVVGTDAFNHIRFEPNLQGAFGRAVASAIQPGGAGVIATIDLNPHLDYTPGLPPLSDAQRALALGDPRGIAWVGTTQALITGMGSNNVGIFSPNGVRTGLIEVGEGPTGIVVHPVLPFAYVVNRFDGSISLVDPSTALELDRVSFYDPTPGMIKAGRKHLFDTQHSSGTGHLSCASCHVDARMDQLAWDLGDPTGEVDPFDETCIGENCVDWHPMKGPMTTQTLQGISGTEPFHWRGDRSGLHEFNRAFVTLLGRAGELTPDEMDQFDAYVTTIRFPPNPFQLLDGSIADTELPNGGNPTSAIGLFNGCAVCHALPSGTNTEILGPLVAAGGFQSMKVPQLRNMHEKSGFDQLSMENNRGFGFIHDGSIATLLDFVSSPVFALSPQQALDMEALLMSFSTDTPAGVGVQVTVDGTDAAALDQRDEMIAVVESGTVALVARGSFPAGVQRGAYYIGNGVFQTDRATQQVKVETLDIIAGPGVEVTYTIVPLGTQIRIGVDRDEDGHFDRDEIAAGTDPADPEDHPGSGGPGPGHVHEAPGIPGGPPPPP